MSTHNTIKKPKSFARERLAIETAAELFPAKGIEPVKMTDVADAAGLGVASLYRYFETKVNLALAAGTLLWSRFNDLFAESLSDDFDRKSGFAQIEELFNLCTHLYRTHPEFVSFLDELDHMVLATTPDAQRLAAYDAEVMKFYPLFAESHKRGVADGTIRDGIDFSMYYLTTSHALMSVGQKLIRGEVVPSDDFSKAYLELQLAVDIMLTYLKPQACNQ